MSDLFSNMLCSCGSQQRYADCCGRAEMRDEAAFYETQAIIEGLNEQLLPMAFNNIDALRDVWCELTGQRDLPPPEWPDFPFFIHWYIWHLRFNIVDEAGAGRVATHAAVHLEHKSNEATAAELEILKASKNSTVSFFRVISVQPGGRMVLHDEFAEVETEILNLKDVEIAEPGDMFVGSILHLSGLSVFLTRAQRAIEPRLHGIIRRIKEHLAEPGVRNRDSQKIVGGYLHLANWMRDDVAQLSLDIPQRLRHNPDWMN